MIYASTLYLQGVGLGEQPLKKGGLKLGSRHVRCTAPYNIIQKRIIGRYHKINSKIISQYRYDKMLGQIAGRPAPGLARG